MVAKEKKQKDKNLADNMAVLKSLTPYDNKLRVKVYDAINCH